jgi:hypothetical protein
LCEAPITSGTAQDRYRPMPSLERKLRTCAAVFRFVSVFQSFDCLPPPLAFVPEGQGRSDDQGKERKDAENWTL